MPYEHVRFMDPRGPTVNIRHADGLLVPYRIVTYRCLVRLDTLIPYDVIPAGNEDDGHEEDEEPFRPSLEYQDITREMAREHSYRDESADPGQEAAPATGEQKEEEEQVEAPDESSLRSTSSTDFNEASTSSHWHHRRRSYIESMVSISEAVPSIPPAHRKPVHLPRWRDLSFHDDSSNSSHEHNVMIPSPESLPANSGNEDDQDQDEIRREEADSIASGYLEQNSDLENSVLSDEEEGDLQRRRNWFCRLFRGRDALGRRRRRYRRYAESNNNNNRAVADTHEVVNLPAAHLSANASQDALAHDELDPRVARLSTSGTPPKDSLEIIRHANANVDVEDVARKSHRRLDFSFSAFFSGRAGGLTRQ